MVQKHGNVSFFLDKQARQSRQLLTNFVCFQGPPRSLLRVAPKVLLNTPVTKIFAKSAHMLIIVSSTEEKRKQKMLAGSK